MYPDLDTADVEGAWCHDDTKTTQCPSTSDLSVLQDGTRSRWRAHAHAAPVTLHKCYKAIIIEPLDGRSPPLLYSARHAPSKSYHLIGIASLMVCMASILLAGCLGEPAPSVRWDRPSATSLNQSRDEDTCNRMARAASASGKNGAELWRLYSQAKERCMQAHGWRVAPNLP